MKTRLIGLIVAGIGVSWFPCGAAAAVEAQQPRVAEIVVPAPDAVQELRLRNGSCVYGRVERIDGDRLTFRTTTRATIEVDRADVLSLALKRGSVVNGEFLPEDSNATRLFFAPTGRSLPRGEGYIGIYEVHLPFVQVGLTSRLSIGAGTPLLFGDVGERPVWVTPKLQVYDGKRTKVATGAIHVFNAGEASAGIAYAVVTQGTPEAGVTVGVGYGYLTGERNGSLILMLGGERRAGRHLKLISENYFWQGRPRVLSGGVRFLGERLSADLGLVVPLGSGIVAVPIVNFVWRF